MGLAAVMSLMTGCSSSKCETVCAEANACGLKERPTDVDCPEYCKDVDAFNERAAKREGGKSCDTEFQAHLDCWQQNTAQICSTEFDGCSALGEAWTDCMAAHCQAVSESEDGATDPNCFDADPALYPF
jgi:hypothetical protein